MQIRMQESVHLAPCRSREGTAITDLLQIQGLLYTSAACGKLNPMRRTKKTRRKTLDASGSWSDTTRTWGEQGCILNFEVHRVATIEEKRHCEKVSESAGTFPVVAVLWELLSSGIFAISHLLNHKWSSFSGLNWNSRSSRSDTKDKQQRKSRNERVSMR